MMENIPFRGNLRHKRGDHEKIRGPRFCYEFMGTPAFLRGTNYLFTVVLSETSGPALYLVCFNPSYSILRAGWHGMVSVAIIREEIAPLFFIFRDI